MNYHRDGTLPTDRSIFVFGSNLAGRHGLGAANVALNGYGAVYGVGVGPQNQSYAIPTKDETLQPLDIGIIRKALSELERILQWLRSTNYFLCHWHWMWCSWIQT
jgi:hypothetical protein